MQPRVDLPEDAEGPQNRLTKILRPAQALRFEQLREKRAELIGNLDFRSFDPTSFFKIAGNRPLASFDSALLRSDFHNALGHAGPQLPEARQIDRSIAAGPGFEGSWPHARRKPAEKNLIESRRWLGLAEEREQGRAEKQIVVRVVEQRSRWMPRQTKPMLIQIGQLPLTGFETVLDDLQQTRADRQLPVCGPGAHERSGCERASISSKIGTSSGIQIPCSFFIFL